MKRNSLPAVLLVLLVTACNLETPPKPPPAVNETPLPPTETPSFPFVHSTPKFQVFILSPLTTCLVGNEFASGNVCAGTACGDCSCGWEDHDPAAPQSGVPPDQINDPQYAKFEHIVCVDIALNEGEIQDIIDDMELVRKMAYEWTGGALDLDMEYTVLSGLFTGFTAPDFVIGPFEIDDELLNEHVSTDTDFVYVVSGVHDRVQGKQLAYWCGSSYGELSIHGSGYSYIQYNEICNSVTISDEKIYEPLIHEWVHNLDWAVYNLNNVADLYQFVGPDWGNWEHASWTACGEGSSDPLDWFPSVDLCEWDPDWMDCNNIASAGACVHAGEVNGNISWYEHVLSAHFPRTIQFVGNICRDGKQDFGESGVDSGGPCP
jgi:hypothetical protein